MRKQPAVRSSSTTWRAEKRSRTGANVASETCAWSRTSSVNASAARSNYAAWNAYGNQYWPALYLLDRAGQVRDAHNGEGNYRRIEGAIRALLAEANEPIAGTETNHAPGELTRTR